MLPSTVVPPAPVRERALLIGLWIWMSATSTPLPVTVLLCVCLCVATAQVFEDIDHIEMSPHPNDLILTFHPRIDPIPSKILL